MTFVEQLVIPFAVLAPFRTVRIAACLAELFFQLCIVGTGNYAWINWIGALPCMALLDDRFLYRFFSSSAITEGATASPHTSSPCSESGCVAMIASVISRAASSVRIAAHVGLLVFILGKSAAPLKELFTPAPWLAYYDDYFFVNAQGVFGFINQHRVQIVLHFTHDPLPPLDAETRRAIARCGDTAGVAAHDRDGRGYRCAELNQFCAQNQHVQKQCPKTCGQCPSRRWDAAADGAISWTPLEFKNLPGVPTRRPRFNSPYHYRLDWETWIHTTASMEHHMERWLAEQKHAKPGVSVLWDANRIAVPNYHVKLVQKVLAGDTDAIGLLGTPASALLRPELHNADTSTSALSPPTAIKVEFFRYTFSNWTRLLNAGEWWDREQMTAPLLFEPDRVTRCNLETVTDDCDQIVRRQPWERHWLLLIATIGVAFELRRGGATGFSLLYIIISALALLAAYPTTWAASAVAHAFGAGGGAYLALLDVQQRVFVMAMTVATAGLVVAASRGPEVWLIDRLAACGLLALLGHSAQIENAALHV